MATEVRSLTGLRGIAASVVVQYHYVEATPQVPSLLREIASRGYLAVDMFFVLSGFVMALTYAHRFAHGFDAPAFGDFLLRRFARIYRLYVVILGLTVLGVGVGAFPGWNLRDSLATVVANFLLIQAWGTTVSLNGPAWSISTEFAAYLLFPMLLRATLFGGGRRAAQATVAAAILLILAAMIRPLLRPGGNGTLDLYRETTPLPLLRCFAGFTFGLLTYRLTGSPGIMQLARQGLAAVVLVALLAAALLLDVNDLAIYTLLPPLVLCLYATRGRPGRVLWHGVIYQLGTLSYAIYLLHVGVLWGAGHLPTNSSLVIDTTAVVALLALASLAHHAVELPGRRLIRKWRVPAPRSAVA
jgi:peptidoglycan/LPS O-acetylase OafA/YrhL